jgi:hypothetical protein
VQGLYILPDFLVKESMLSKRVGVQGGSKSRSEAVVESCRRSWQRYQHSRACCKTFQPVMKEVKVLVRFTTLSVKTYLFRVADYCMECSAEGENGNGT